MAGRGYPNPQARSSECLVVLGIGDGGNGANPPLRFLSYTGEEGEGWDICWLYILLVHYGCCTKLISSCTFSLLREKCDLPLLNLKQANCNYVDSEYALSTSEDYTTIIVLKPNRYRRIKWVKIKFI